MQGFWGFGVYGLWVSQSTCSRLTVTLNDSYDSLSNSSFSLSISYLSYSRSYYTSLRLIIIDLIQSNMANHSRESFSHSSFSDLASNLLLWWAHSQLFNSFSSAWAMVSLLSRSSKSFSHFLFKFHSWTLVCSAKSLNLQHKHHSAQFYLISHSNLSSSE